MAATLVAGVAATVREAKVAERNRLRAEKRLTTSANSPIR